MSTTADDPISVVFVTSGTRGDRLLFRYPFQQDSFEVASKKKGRNPYAVPKSAVISEFLQNKKGTISGLEDKTVANLLGVKSSLCSQNFDVKVDDVRFVGFPLLLDEVRDKQTPTGKSAHKILSFNVAFVLQAETSASAVSCYHDLAKQLTVGLRHEEKRSQFLSTEAKIMTSVHDEVASMTEDSYESPFGLILQKSQLAKDLRKIHDSLHESGVVHLYINNWVLVSFCLPHKLHTISAGTRTICIEPEVIQKCLECLRPYHGMLLLEEEQTLLESLPVDCTPALGRLIQVAKPTRSLQTLALEADLSLSQVLQLVCHLVYWSKATIIYPLCETNVYVLSPVADTLVTSPLVEKFVQEFPGRSLPVEMSEFSFPTQLREARDVLNHPRQQDLKVRMVLWMLEHHLLIQLHTYVFFVPSVTRRKKKGLDDVTKMPIVHEEKGREGGLYENSLFPTSPSMSDVASVTSEESCSLGPPPVSMMSKSPSSEFTTDSSLMSEENKSNWMMVESSFSQLTREEKECIANIPASRNQEDLKMFARLFPYFDGKHHIEEIMYYENLRRSQLLVVLDKFREVLIMCSYADPATMFYDR